MLDATISSFSYAEDPILQNVQFQLDAGEHLFLLGESGCGKSTLLHLVYGLMDLSDGSILWKDKQLYGPSQNLIPGHRFMKLVSQEFDLMPFTTVSENVASHLSRSNLEKDASTVKTLLEVVDLTSFAHKKVKDLSGGQKQRVALAKALAKEPELLLLDEPFSHIDTFRKNKLRRDLFNYLKEKHISCIVATHDSNEALSYANRIMLLKDGSIEALDTPQHIYRNISSSYQASFFDEVSVLPAGLPLESYPSEEKILLPHQFKISDRESELQVVVKKSYFRGSHFLVHATVQNHDIFFNSTISHEKGETIYLTWNPIN